MDERVAPIMNDGHSFKVSVRHILAYLGRLAFESFYKSHQSM